MYYKLIKEMPNHDIGDLLFKNECVYEWFDIKDYPVLIEVVENNNDFFEKLNFDWVTGDKIYYMNSCLTIVENMFDPRSHLQLVNIGNAFKNVEDVEKLIKNNFQYIKKIKKYDRS